jgi:hypothetical protein
MEMRRSSSSYDSSLEHIAKRLRDDHENVTREALPKRWVDLIHCLNEQERQNLDRSQPAADGVAEAESGQRPREGSERTPTTRA